MAKYLLTASQGKSIKTRPGKKITKYHDGEGLYLWVNDTDNYKRWFFRYTNKEGTRKELLLGNYPLISLEEARKRADEARVNKARGIDPVEHRKAKKVAEKNKHENSFEVVAREWFNTKRLHLSEATKTCDLANLKNDILPAIGSMNISEITPKEILAMLRKIEARNAGQTAHRTRTQCSMIFRYAIATERCSSDPCRDLVDALKPTVKKHRAAITDMARFAELLKAVDSYKGTAIARIALKLMPLLVVRSGELRFAKWKDINFETGEWTFKAEKTHVDHIVPLPRQAIKLLKELKEITFKDPESYLFPQLNRNGRVMSENTLNYALRGLGFPQEEICNHGFRTTVKTELLELDMADTYYTPDALKQGQLNFAVDNIKPDRTSDDLLFQVLLDCGVELSLPIKKESVAGLQVYFVDENALAACFVKNGEISDDFCKELAKRQPLRVVFRDSGFKDDSAKINAEQIFKLLSPHTEVKSL